MSLLTQPVGLPHYMIVGAILFVTGVVCALRVTSHSFGGVGCCCSASARTSWEALTVQSRWSSSETASPARGSCASLLQSWMIVEIGDRSYAALPSSKRR